MDNLEKKKEISSKIENELEMLEVPIREEDVEKTWDDMKTKITNIQEKDIGFTANQQRTGMDDAENTRPHEGQTEIQGKANRIQTFKSSGKSVGKRKRSGCRQSAKK